MTALLHNLQDTIRCNTGVFVLPHTYGQPPSLFQKSVRVAVAGHVRRQLFFPPLGVGPWRCPMLRAHVPEAPVDEDCHLRWAEHDVGSSPYCRKHLTIESKAQAEVMQLATQPDLRLGVASALATHPA